MLKGFSLACVKNDLTIKKIKNKMDISPFSKKILIANINLRTRAWRRFFFCRISDKMYYMMKIIKKWKLDYILVFVTMSLYYGWLQWPRYIGDPDGFYHAKIVSFLKNGQLLETMPWMQFSTLRDSFTDHHLLYHILILPFTYLTDNPLIAIKIATVVFTV